MKKKTYQQPKMQVVKIEQTDIICASVQSDMFSLDGNLGYEEDNWSNNLDLDLDEDFDLN